MNNPTNEPVRDEVDELIEFFNGEHSYWVNITSSSLKLAADTLAAQKKKLGELNLYKSAYKKLKARYNTVTGKWPPKGASYISSPVDSVLELEIKNLKDKVREHLQPCEDGNLELSHEELMGSITEVLNAIKEEK